MWKFFCSLTAIIKKIILKKRERETTTTKNKNKPNNNPKNRGKIDLSTKLVDGVGWKAPPSKCCKCEKSGVVPVTNDVISDEFLYLPLGDHGIEQIHAAILPLDWTIDVQRVAQPIVR